MIIWEAAARGDLDQVRAFVEQHGGSVHYEDLLGRTPLLLAAGEGHIGVARCLILGGANINHRAENGSTALYAACAGGHAGVVSLLLQRGADVIAGEFNALSVAAVNGRDAIVGVLLEHGGSDLDADDEDGSTAMHYACFNGNAGVLRQLLEAGADPALRSVEGRTAVDVAAHRGHRDCVRMIQEWDGAYRLQRARRLRDAASTSVTDASQQHSS